jgi:hypothetical protein
MKYEFLTGPWFAALHGIISEKARNAAKANPDFRYSTCEIFDGVPPELANMPGGKTAWYARVEGDKVEFGLAELDDTSFKALADYAAVLPLARFDTMGRADRTEELQARSAALVAEGRLTLLGSLPSANECFSDLHDAIARLTA